MPIQSSTRFALGQPVPGLTLPDAGAGGAVHDIGAEIYGSLVLIVFPCTHCPYAKHPADSLGRLTNLWMDSGLAVFAINSNDPIGPPSDAPAKMADFADAHGWRFPYLIDGNSPLRRYLPLSAPPACSCSTKSNDNHITASLIDFALGADSTATGAHWRQRSI